MIIYLLHGDLAEAEMHSVYNHEKVKCLISLSHGEGFGLPLLESAACGLPVMTTNWSAHLDFLNLGKFIPINYKLIDIPERKVDGRIFVENTKWAEPLEDDFKKKGVIAVMAVDNLPCELPKDSSEYFGHEFINKVLPYLIGEDPDRVIERATICKDGNLTPDFEYLRDYLNGI